MRNWLSFQGIARLKIVTVVAVFAIIVGQFIGAGMAHADALSAGLCADCAHAASMSGDMPAMATFCCEDHGTSNSHGGNLPCGDACASMCAGSVFSLGGLPVSASNEDVRSADLRRESSPLKPRHVDFSTPPPRG